MQIQALIAEGVGAAKGSNIGSNIEMAKLLVFNGEAEKVEGFITTCRLYLKMWMRGATVEEQIQWVLLYMQGELADVWKENILENLETREVEFRSVGEFLLELKKRSLEEKIKNQ